MIGISTEIYKPLLEDVFKRSGIPDYTFVPPKEYTQLLVALRTLGLGVVVEGPSGIGKTTSVTKALEELKTDLPITKYNGLRSKDKEAIKSLPDDKDIGLVIIDDFHWLDSETQKHISKLMKLFADEDSKGSKIVIIGINNAGTSLVHLTPDLTGRIEVIKFKLSSEDAIFDMIGKGEEELNITISAKKDIVDDSQGCFSVAQTLCFASCIHSGVIEQQDPFKSIDISFAQIREPVIDEMSRTFFDLARKFATGPRLHPEGRAPYLFILYWLSKSVTWSIRLNDIAAQDSNYRSTLRRIVSSGTLKKFFNDNEEFARILHFNPETTEVSAEDPKFMYYLRNIIWHNFARNVGYLNVSFESQYDFALSFPGEEREIAEAIYKFLSERDISVFYDFAEQSRMLAVEVDEYLAPIYRAQSKFVVAILGPQYSRKIWTKFESREFKDRLGEDAVIPIWFSDSQPSVFDPAGERGNIFFDRSKNFESEINRVGLLLVEKLRDLRLFDYSTRYISEEVDDI